MFLTAFSIRVSLLSSKTHNGGDTPKEITGIIRLDAAGILTPY